MVKRIGNNTLVNVTKTWRYTYSMYSLNVYSFDFYNMLKECDCFK